MEKITIQILVLFNLSYVDLIKATNCKINQNLFSTWNNFPLSHDLGLEEGQGQNFWTFYMETIGPKF